MLKLIPNKHEYLKMILDFEKKFKIDSSKKSLNENLVTFIGLLIIIFIIWLIFKIGFSTFLLSLVFIVSVLFLIFYLKSNHYFDKNYETFIKFYEMLSMNTKLLLALEKIDKIDKFSDKHTTIRLVREMDFKISEKDYLHFVFTYMYIKRTVEFLKGLKQSKSTTKEEIIIDCYQIFGENIKDYYSLIIIFLRIHYSWDMMEMIIDKILENYKKDRNYQNFKDRVNRPIEDDIQDINIDNFSGYEFENFLVILYKKMGYKVTHTKLTGDQGADLIIERNGEKNIIQAKCYEGSVGNKAVQEATAAVRFYQAVGGIVVTNSTFTKSAIELAKSNKIKLIGREKLLSLIEEFL